LCSNQKRKEENRRRKKERKEETTNSTGEIEREMQLYNPSTYASTNEEGQTAGVNK